jgi:hypothetical protein
MKEERSKKIFLTLYIVTILILAVIYFAQPERKLFIENTVKWWTEFLIVIKNLFS